MFPRKDVHLFGLIRGCMGSESVIFEKSRYCRPVVHGKSLMSVGYSFNAIQIVVLSTQVMMLCSSVCLLVYLPLCAMCESLCVRACKLDHYLCEISSERNTLLPKPYSKAQGTKARKS